MTPMMVSVTAPAIVRRQQIFLFINIFPFSLKPNGNLEQEGISTVPAAVLVIKFIIRFDDGARVDPIVESGCLAVIFKAHGSLLLFDHVVSDYCFKSLHDDVVHAAR